MFSSPTSKTCIRNIVLLKFRIWFYSLAFIHLIVVAIKLLTINFRESHDPELWVYQEYRWKLITAWFNLLSLAYFPICIYCDWRELWREATRLHVRFLNKIRFICFTNILFPTTTFADTLFWRLWNKDRELVAPSSVDSFVPFWTQHSMHTVTLVVVILDLILVPRKRPDNLLHASVPMFMFLGCYTIMSVFCILNGEYLYPVLKSLSSFKLFLLGVYVFLENSLYYICQWFVYDFIWGQSVANTPKLRKSSRFSETISPVVRKHHARRQISRLL